ncbi:unnamed protein product [Cuscuta campestris]|uniref:SURP motif domain-containing protein n=1 Tax=Cuscuta campestris TaxID=132261 RepID=A0A484K8E0_9ASTE|nr:unnamed protein product [Cuscuta campestris]
MERSLLDSEAAASLFAQKKNEKEHSYHMAVVQPFEACNGSNNVRYPQQEIKVRIIFCLFTDNAMGSEYHDIVREEAENKPDFNFLFGGTGHYYYHYMLQMAVRQPYGSYVPFHSSFRQTKMQQPPNPITTAPSPLIAPQYNASPSGGFPASVLGPPHHMH